MIAGLDVLSGSPRRGHLAATVVLLVGLIALPFALDPIFGMKLLCYAIFGISVNLLGGFVGLVSFGHAAYFGIGGYVTAWTAKTWGLSPELAVLVGSVVAGALGACLGWLAIKCEGLYFAMATLALAQMVYFFCLQAPFTGGEDGIQRVPRGNLFGVFSLAPDWAMYSLVAVVFLATFALSYRIIHSPFGQVVTSIRENETRAASLGYLAANYKLIAFVISATLAGLGGGLKSLVFGIATLTDVQIATSGNAVLMALVGGLGTIFGPIFGAAVVAGMENYLVSLGAFVLIAQGATFILCVLIFRRGAIGELNTRFKLNL